MSTSGIQSAPQTSVATTPQVDPRDAKLRRAAADLEGVFIMELLKVMRETVPEGGVVDGGMGEEMFSSMLDQHLAPQVGDGWDRGIGAALYRQLRGQLEVPAIGEEGNG